MTAKELKRLRRSGLLELPIMADWDYTRLKLPSAGTPAPTADRAASQSTATVYRQ